MSSLICNGSPRGENSNSQVMSNWIFEDGDKTILIKSIKKFTEFLEYIEEYNKIIIIYPLYVDGMPGIVKEFFEFIEDNKEIVKNKDFLFIVHCGFDEAIHLRVVERYHRILADIYELKSVNTVLTPGSEGVRLMPDKMTKKRRTNILLLVSSFRQGEELSKTVLNTLAGDEILTNKKRRLFRILNIFGLTNMYWNSQLKKNKAYDNRFDRPY